MNQVAYSNMKILPPVKTKASLITAPENAQIN